MSSYWANDLFTVVKVNRFAIIAKSKIDRKVFARNISMVQKYKHISDSDNHSDVDSSGSAEMNTKDTHPDNKGSNADYVEMVDSANNVRGSFRTRSPPI